MSSKIKNQQKKVPSNKRQESLKQDRDRTDPKVRNPEQKSRSYNWIKYINEMED